MASFLLVILTVNGAPAAMRMPQGNEHVNSIGMRLGRIEPGTFVMGNEAELPEDLVRLEYRRCGDFDEKPIHKVTISRPFYIGACEVTNAEYEQFDPEHAKLRGKLGFSKEDDEAVVFVSWHEAVAFCRWLSNKEGLPYRLPTEAEWEYACRAGTTTPYQTGDTLPEAFHKNPRPSWFPAPARSREGDVVPLTVGQTSPNPWGLQDMHGNVEEWCHDWYGPYEEGDQVDPVGLADGEFRVTRGGSHSTELYFLRSANRMGTLPEERSWLIGFRVVLGEMPKSKPLPAPPTELHSRNVKQRVPRGIEQGPDPDTPHFHGPRKFVRIPDGTNGPIFSRHNHVPALVECPNGDLLAVWYSCVEEPGREVALAGSRLRYGEEEWDPASLFWSAPDRTETSNALWFDGKRMIYEFIGLSAAATWGPTITVMRTSRDNGATWSRARIICPEHGTRRMPIDGVFATHDGAIVLPCDAVTTGHGGTAIHVSRDGGKTWVDPGGKTAGIHAGIAELKDGRLLAFGRGDEIDGRMAKSISADMGQTWTYSASEFPPIGGGQRLQLVRLQEGPLLFVSFAKDTMVRDVTENERPVNGLFAALSYDEGETWPVKRLVSDDGPGREVETMDGRPFTMSAESAEPRGYLSVCQARNGVIHLVSSRQHYAFNLAWLQTPPPPGPPPPQARELPVKQSLAVTFGPTGLPSEADPPWRFTGSGMAEAEAVSFPGDGAMEITTGPDQRARWASTSGDGFGSADRQRGFTAEICMQVLRSTTRLRGIDFEAYVGDGTPEGNRYFITVTRTGVYYHRAGGFAVLAEDIDNHSEMHTYRIAAREDGIAQIYRDGDLLGVVRPDHSVDGMLRPGGPYLQWGEGAGASEADAVVAHVAHDLSGPSQPSP